MAANCTAPLANSTDFTAPLSAPVATTPHLKVAFIGDSGAGAGFASVIQLIKEEEVDLVMHQGDFSYRAGPTPKWLAAISQLDPAIPYLGADGNHDNWPEYAPFFEEQVQKRGVSLSHGSVAASNYAVTYQGLRVLFHEESGNNAFNRQVLVDDSHIWKICSWHYNRRDFQAGGKADIVELKTYQTCINAGALIATGHEHSYSRSYTLANLSAPSHGALGEPTIMQVARGNPGKSFLFVSGLGGNTTRDYHADLHDDDGWWATIYTSNRYCQNTCTATDFSGQDKHRDIASYDYTWGALFIEFNVDNNPYKARGYFKTVDGDIIDEFTILKERDAIQQSGPID